MAKKKTKDKPIPGNAWCLIDEGENGKRWLQSVDDRWYNVKGGWHPKSMNQGKVLEFVTGVAYDDLDHKKTSLFILDGESGWLSPAGRWFPCHYQHHDLYAHLILRMDVGTMESTGWVRVWRGPNDTSMAEGMPFFAHGSTLAHKTIRLTAEQRNWLVKQGHTVEDWR